MTRRKHAFAGLATISLWAISGCVQTRSADVLGKAQQMVAEAKALADTLRSIKDEASALSSMADVRDRYKKLSASMRTAYETSASADSHGGITKASADKVAKEMVTFKQKAAEVESEIDRLRKVRGLPRDFWMTLRVAQFDYLEEHSKSFQKFVSADIAKFAQDSSALLAKHSPDRIVVEFGTVNKPGEAVKFETVKGAVIEVYASRLREATGLNLLPALARLAGTRTGAFQARRESASP